MKLIMTGITICIILIALKLTIFTTSLGSDLIPGVTTKDYLINIESNSSLGEYVLRDSFALDVSGKKIDSKSEIYVTNETDGETLYGECRNAFISNSYEQEHEDIYEKEGRYTGVYRNESRKIIFYIFDNADVLEHVGYSLILIVNKGRL